MISHGYRLWPIHHLDLFERTSGLKCPTLLDFDMPGWRMRVPVCWTWMWLQTEKVNKALCTSPTHWSREGDHVCSVYTGGPHSPEPLQELLQGPGLKTQPWGWAGDKGTSLRPRAHGCIITTTTPRWWWWWDLQQNGNEPPGSFKLQAGITTWKIRPPAQSPRQKKTITGEKIWRAELCGCFQWNVIPMEECRAFNHLHGSWLSLKKLPFVHVTPLLIQAFLLSQMYD